MRNPAVRITTDLPCHPGCGKVGAYTTSTGKILCSDQPAKCSARNTRSQATEIATTFLCDYGCGQTAKYRLSRKGKLCCECHANKCPSKRISKTKSGKLKQLYIPLVNSDLMCKNDCGNAAKYQISTGHYCSYPTRLCPNHMVRKIGNRYVSETEEEYFTRIQQYPFERLAKHQRYKVVLREQNYTCAICGNRM